MVVTGNVPGLSRSLAEEAVAYLGGKAASSVSKKTDLVVYGEKAGSKLDKARQLQLPLLSAEDFLKLLEETKKE